MGQVLKASWLCPCRKREQEAERSNRLETYFANSGGRVECSHPQRPRVSHNAGLYRSASDDGEVGVDARVELSTTEEGGDGLSDARDARAATHQDHLMHIARRERRELHHRADRKEHPREQVGTDWLKVPPRHNQVELCLRVMWGGSRGVVVEIGWGDEDQWDLQCGSKVCAQFDL